MSNHSPIIKTRYFKMIAGSFILIVASVGVGQSVFALESYYATRIVPGVFVGPINASNLTRDELRILLSRYASSLEKNGIRVHYKDREVLLTASSLSLDPDVPIEANPPIAELHIDETLNAAFAIGHSSNGLVDILQFGEGFFHTTLVHPHVSVDAASLQKALSNDFGQYENETVSPHFVAKKNTINVIEGKDGMVLNTVKAAQDINRLLDLLEIPSITLEMNTVVPSVKSEELQSLIPNVSALLDTSPNAFNLEQKKFPLDRALLVQWIIPAKDTPGVVQYDQNAIREYLSQTLSPLVNIKAEAPRFSVDNGTLRALSAPVAGKTIDIDATLAAFNAWDSTSQERSIPLAMKDAPDPATPSWENLAVKEVIASGETNFKGSPQNRKKNIAIGMSRINGLLVMPDEEFSLIKALGPIDGENGFLPELVIKGDKTKPEFGGGLCQVSTTLFRAVATAGLPVIERRNHSYRVSYYEPPVGFDATIYFPKPDFRFTNDTGQPILILASVSGTIAHVTLWGTKDGRTVEIDKPTVFNIVKAPEVKYIETTTLKPGQKKCTEHAHNGADAIFERRVTSTSGEEKKDIFKSHYVVWPAVCLIGKAAETLSATMSTSTPSSLLSAPQSNSTTTASQ